MAKNVDRIETKRLMLRGIDETDTDSIVCWRSDPKVYKYFKQPHEINAVEHNNWYKTRYLFNEDRCDWMCIEKESSNKIGVFGLARDGEIVEVNYILSLEARHKGYAAEGVTALINYARTQWKAKKIVAEIHKANLPSIVFIKRLGFELESFEGEFQIYRIEA